MVSSTAAYHSTMGNPAYNASKTGAVGLTRTLGRGVGRGWHPRQRHRARARRHQDDEGDDRQSQAARRCVVAHSAAAIGHAGRHGGRGNVPGLAVVVLHHRSDAGRRWRGDPVARMERSVIRDRCILLEDSPDFAPLHPGYTLSQSLGTALLLIGYFGRPPRRSMMDKDGSRIGQGIARTRRRRRRRSRRRHGDAGVGPAREAAGKVQNLYGQAKDAVRDAPDTATTSPRTPEQCRRHASGRLAGDLAKGAGQSARRTAYRRRHRLRARASDVAPGTSPAAALALLRIIAARHSGLAPRGAPRNDNLIQSNAYRTTSAERPTLPGGRGIAGLGFGLRGAGAS